MALPVLPTIMAAGSSTHVMTDFLNLIRIELQHLSLTSEHLPNPLSPVGSVPKQRMRKVHP